MTPSPLLRLRAVAALAVSALLAGSLQVAVAQPRPTAPVDDTPVAVTPVGTEPAPGDRQGVLDDGTRTRSFNDGWRFALVDARDTTDPTGAYADAAEPGYDDSSWRALDLPHDWSIELDPTPEGTTADSGFYQGGLGWYRKTFTLPPEMAGKDLSLELDGVYMDSTVYVNGEPAAEHPYGYTGFAVDLTDRVVTDGQTPNTVAVRVRNKLPSSRWYSGSGIYRNTHLVVTDPVHVARWGTAVTTPGLERTVDDGYALVRVETTVENESGSASRARLRTVVEDADGAVVAESTSPLRTRGSRTDVDLLRVEDPRLWSTQDPYRYAVRSEVVVAGEVVDTTTTRFGVRWVGIDPDEGLLLNGEHLKIQGVDLHHDLGALGAAVDRDAIERQMRIMRSMGVNAFRTSHNPPSPEMMDVCDELGILTMVEAFDTWRTPKRPYDYGRFFDEWSTRDIQEMVRAHRNSPSVMLWSIGNEIPDSTRPVGVGMAQDLVDAVREVDTTRQVTIGSDKYRSVPREGSPQDLIAQVVDGVGLNYNTAMSVDALHARYPDTFFYESESSSAESSRGVYQDPDLVNTGEDYTPGQRLTSSYDNNMASWTMSGEYGLKKDRDRPWFAGEFLWSGMDYLGEPTPYFDQFPVKSSFFGAVDTAGFPKDLYHLFRSRWTAEPMVHLLPMDWTDHEPGETVDVWAYANVDTVELFLDGRSLGVRTFDTKTTPSGEEYLETTEPSRDDKSYPSGSYTSPNGSSGQLHLEWEVPFAPGELVAVATRGGEEVARDTLRTAGEATAVSATPETYAVPADGHSLAYVDLDVVDDAGVRVPSADDSLEVEVSGGALVGLDNGRQESAENYTASSRRAFGGRALAIVQAGEVPGPITVTVRGDGLEPATTTVYALDPAEATGQAPVAVEPVSVRAEVDGGDVRLPPTATVVRADGTVQQRAVTWDAIPAGALDEPGTVTVGGQVVGTSLPAEASVTAFAWTDVADVSTSVPAGAPPMLPGEVLVTASDGVGRYLPVTWEAVDPDRYADPGSVTVRGEVAGTSLTASARVRVVPTPEVEDVALATSVAAPAADASFSGAPGTLPAAMLDGSVGGAAEEEQNGWSSYYRKSATALLPAVSAAHPSEWVSVSWPAAQRLTGEVSATFLLDEHKALPEQLRVSAWDGSAYVPVEDLSVQRQGASLEPTTLTFDPVTTTSLRVEMTSPAPWTDEGFFHVAELGVRGLPVG